MVPLMDTTNTKKRKLDECLASLHNPNTGSENRERASPTSVVQDDDSDDEEDEEVPVWIAQYQANDPSEDRYDYILHLNLDPNNDIAEKGYNLSLWAVYDGHGGTTMAEYCQNNLLPHCAVAVSNALQCTITNHDIDLDRKCDLQCDQEEVDHSAVEEALKTAFQIVDETFLSDLSETDVQTCCYKNGSWNVGACALVTALVVPHDEDEASVLYTAHCGDCRGLLLTNDDDQDGKENIIAKATRVVDAEHKSFLPVPIAEEVVQSKYSHLQAVTQLTEDHSASDNVAEQQLVLERTDNARRAIFTTANNTKRVAGSLAITRAMGDAYLKHPNLSFGLYKEYWGGGPYITSTPATSHTILSFGERSNTLNANNENSRALLLLGSDGVFEKMSNKEILQTVQDYEEGDTHLADNIVDAVLDNVCDRLSGNSCISITKRALSRLSPGRSRRSKHDDITCMVIDLHRICLE